MGLESESAVGNSGWKEKRGALEGAPSSQDVIHFHPRRRSLTTELMPIDI